MSFSFTPPSASGTLSLHSHVHTSRVNPEYSAEELSHGCYTDIASKTSIADKTRLRRPPPKEAEEEEEEPVANVVCP